MLALRARADLPSLVQNTPVESETYICTLHNLTPATLTRTDEYFFSGQFDPKWTPDETVAAHSKMDFGVRKTSWPIKVDAAKWKGYPAGMTFKATFPSGQETRFAIVSSVATTALTMTDMFWTGLHRPDWLCSSCVELRG